jgi:hypothetical protein
MKDVSAKMGSPNTQTPGRHRRRSVACMMGLRVHGRFGKCDPVSHGRGRHAGFTTHATSPLVACRAHVAVRNDGSGSPSSLQIGDNLSRERDLVHRICANTRWMQRAVLQPCSALFIRSLWRPLLPCRASPRNHLHRFECAAAPLARWSAPYRSDVRSKS